jgi:hypothetical protein
VTVLSWPLVLSELGRERVLVVSRFQFARPAVVVRVFDQISCTPPVLAASDEIWPFVMVESSSARKPEANASFDDSNVLRSAISDFVRFVGDNGGVVEEYCDFLPGDLSVFCGEYVSFQVLTASAVQKASRLGLRGGVGIRSFFLEGDWRRDFDGDCGGGVVVRGGVDILTGLKIRGGEYDRMASLFSLSEELAGRDEIIGRCFNRLNGLNGGWSSSSSKMSTAMDFTGLFSSFDMLKASNEVASAGIGGFSASSRLLLGNLSSFRRLGNSSSEESSELPIEPQQMLSSKST